MAVGKRLQGEEASRRRFREGGGQGTVGFGLLRSVRVHRRFLSAVAVL